MPALSKKQQKFFGIVRAIQKGEQTPTTPETAKAAADMKKSDVKKFASTKHKGLPEKKVTKEEKNGDHEPEMIRNQLKTAGRASKRIEKHSRSKKNFKAWVQSKITKASDYLDTAADYLDSKEVKENNCGCGQTPCKTYGKGMKEESNPRIPRKPGQPAGSKKHSDLYTDENPKGTIHGLGFKDVATAKASVSKIRNSSRSHAHKIQAAVAMEQRAREMGKTSEAAVYRKFINTMKKKTKKMNEAANPAQQAAIAINMKKRGKKPKDVSEEGLRDWFGKSSGTTKSGRKVRGWVQVGGKYDGKPCARQPGQKTTPKCVSSAKRRSMSDKERDSAARRKRAADPGQPQKTGAAKPTMVSTDPKKKMNEAYGGKGESRKAKLASIHPPTAQAAIKNIPTETDRGSGNKAARRAGMEVKTKNPTLQAYLRNKKKLSERHYGASVNKIPAELDKAVALHKSQAKRLRDSDEVKKDAGKAANAIPAQLDKAVAMHSKQAKTLRKAGVSEKYVNVGGKMVDRGDGGVGSYKKQGGYLNTPARKKADAEYAKNNPKRKPFEPTKRGTMVGNKLNDEVQYEAKDKKGKGSGSKDACYHKVKSRYSVWPSAYASGALVKCRKVGAANWGNSRKEEFERDGISFMQFQEKCWPGYEKKGMKTMFGKRYPNCVKKKKTRKEEVEHVYEDDMKGMSVKSGHKRPTKSGAGMTQKGVEAYRRRNPGSKLKTAVTTKPSKLKKGSKAANRRKSYCARSAGQMKKFPKAAKDPNSRLRQARRRWNC